MTRRVAPVKPNRVPLKIVGSNKFGRYPKISAEATFNMFESDGWMVPTPGHIKVGTLDPNGEGRGLFTSTRGNFMILVIDNVVYKVTQEIKKFGRTIPVDDPSEQAWTQVGTIDTFDGDVFIDENLNEEIGICDKSTIYIYNYRDDTFVKLTLDFTPGYIVYHDTYFLAPDLDTPEWRLSLANKGTDWPSGVGTNSTGGFQTKTDNPRAVIRVPGKGNQVFVIGSVVTESWNDIGYKLFPYYRSNSFNIDYGTVNQATIATSDKFVIWLGLNEKSSPIILLSTGGRPEPISTDGIDLVLAELTTPEDAYGFIYKNQGHLFYQLTFNTDKVTYLYDFNTNKSFFVTDEKMQNHIAKRVTFFKGDYYFVSLIDGNLYRLSPTSTTYDGELIPRVRVCNTVRLVDSDTFIMRKMGFTIEQGDDTDNAAIDVSISKDGGVSFGNPKRYPLNSLGNRKNKLTIRDLGRANDFTAQFRFWGDGRFVCTDGYYEYYQ